MLVGHPQAPACATTRKECRLQTPSLVYGKDRQTDDDRNQDVTMLQMVVPATLLSFFFFTSGLNPALQLCKGTRNAYKFRTGRSNF